MIDAIDAGEAFTGGASTEAMQSRCKQYEEFRKKGLDHLVKMVPYAFLIVNGTWRSESQERIETDPKADEVAQAAYLLSGDMGGPLVYLEVRLGLMLQEMIASLQQWRKQSGE